MNVAAAGTTVKAPSRKHFWSLRRRNRADHSVSFPELVWLHHLRQEELKKRGHDPYDGPAEQRYRRYLRWFEEEHGKIVDSYWCVNDASGVALTVRRRPLMFPDVVRLHWATDWTTKDKPKLMNVLYRAMGKAERVATAPGFCDACFTGDYPIALTDISGGTRQLSLLADVA